ncbi:SNF7 protein [Nitrosopumilaceae archaeon]|nr:hypothetical protein [Nitrosopumilus sp.]CAI9831570.1 SNF7 protein [Nitrosopumilaceae archaeon]MDA7941615.1 hypothetical protein [Nitrosopumilus sp.]MDA7943875.1 hypothetical protein [Nitrosopumilus sp.]MDA7945606.1 hypothetical protein [Nitrosopumilus sp.]
MLSSWGRTGSSLSGKIIGRRPEPLKNKIETAHRLLDAQINKLEGIGEKLRKQDDRMFKKVVAAQAGGNKPYAQACAIELEHVRRVRRTVDGARVRLDQTRLRLDTISELGDVVVTLSPCMSIIKGLAPSLGGLMPEANASMEDLSQTLGEMLSGTEASIAPETGVDVSSDARAILEEAQSEVAGRTMSAIPDVPADLKHDIVSRRGLEA